MNFNWFGGIFAFTIPGIILGLMIAVALGERKTPKMASRPSRAKQRNLFIHSISDDE